MYMPGRLRTASSPLRTLMLLESYSWPLGVALLCGSVIAAAALRDLCTWWRKGPETRLYAHRHHDVLVVVAVGHGDEGAGSSVPERQRDVAVREIDQHVEDVVDIESD